MRKTLIKFLTLVLSFTAVIAISLFAGACSCDGAKGKYDIIDGPNSSANQYLDIDTENLSLIVGDERKLSVSYSKEEGKKPSFTSADSNIASVSAEGKITANNKGSTKITVTYGNLVKECSVDVSFGNYIPELSFEGGVLDEYGVGLDGVPYEFVPVINFNGKTFYVAQVSYVSNNTSVAKFENGNQLKAVSLGKTTATITASWRGFTVDAVPGLQKTINVSSNNVINILVNGEVMEEIEVYVLNGTFQGKSYKNYVDFKAAEMSL